MSNLTICGATRPRDGVTICNQEATHSWDHMALAESRPDGDSGATYRPAFATWDRDGIESCDHCGHSIDNASGMCTAPISAAD